MQLSFEEAQSDNKSDNLSFRMNEPAVKDAYLKFVKSFSQSNKDDDSIAQTPSNTQVSILSTSVDDLFPSQNRYTPVHEEAPIEGSPERKHSIDSGVSLSQEFLNRKEVREAYLECMGPLMEQEQVVKSNKKARKASGPLQINKFSKKNGNLKKRTPEVKKIKEKVKKNIEFKAHKKANKKKEPTKGDHAVESELPKSKTMSLYDRMISIQESRNVGLYALCDNCDKARYLPDVKDPLDLPDKWYCNMNPDEHHNKCSHPEDIDEDEDYLIDNLFNAGSIVWAKMDGYPWWPAMVEDDPDMEDYFWLEKDQVNPTWYHVTFFDSRQVTRAWLRPSCLKPFKINMTNPEFQTPRFDKHKSRVSIAFKQAAHAIELPLIDRLRKYSFIQRYPKSLVYKLVVEIDDQEKNPRVVVEKKRPWIGTKGKENCPRVETKEKTKRPRIETKRKPKCPGDGTNREKVETNRKKSPHNQLSQRKKPRKFARIVSSDTSSIECDDNILDSFNIDWQNNVIFNDIPLV
ncbi:hypothetical protein JTB14_013859 [Gonioctena quinquepunctata]|nr:hypothetical protein JTB14_013859 [Gonioctena quinquepunctata]